MHIVLVSSFPVFVRIFELPAHFFQLVPPKKVSWRVWEKLLSLGLNILHASTTTIKNSSTVISIKSVRPKVLDLTRKVCSKNRLPNVAKQFSCKSWRFENFLVVVCPSKWIPRARTQNSIQYGRTNHSYVHQWNQKNSFSICPRSQHDPTLKVSVIFPKLLGKLRLLENISCSDPIAFVILFLGFLIWSTWFRRLIPSAFPISGICFPHFCSPRSMTFQSLIFCLKCLESLRMKNGGWTSFVIWRIVWESTLIISRAMITINIQKWQYA